MFSKQHYAPVFFHAKDLGKQSAVQSAIISRCRIAWDRTRSADWTTAGGGGCSRAKLAQRIRRRRRPESWRSPEGVVGTVASDQRGVWQLHQVSRRRVLLCAQPVVPQSKCHKRCQGGAGRALEAPLNVVGGIAH